MDRVNIFSFSGIYNEENFWRELSEDGSRFRAVSFDFFDLTELPGTSGYLSDDAAVTLRERIAALPRGTCLNFIDSGNTHYMTKLLSERVKSPYILLLIDHHPDMLPPAFGGLLSCGSWVSSALDSDNDLAAVLMVGVDEALADEALKQCSDGDSRAFLTAGSGLEGSRLLRGAVDGSLSATFAGKALRLLPEAVSRRDVTAAVRLLKEMARTALDGAGARTFARGAVPVYISVDKDVLSPDAVTTNWNQGEMSPDTLFELLRAVADEPDIRIVGADICGECSPAPFYGDGAGFSQMIRQNDEINAKLLDIFLNER